jgi:phage FluMu protein gp41
MDTHYVIGALLQEFEGRTIGSLTARELGRVMQVAQQLKDADKTKGKSQ